MCSISFWKSNTVMCVFKGFPSRRCFVSHWTVVVLLKSSKVKVVDSKFPMNHSALDPKKPLFYHKDRPFLCSNYRSQIPKAGRNRAADPAVLKKAAYGRFCQRCGSSLSVGQAFKLGPARTEPFWGLCRWGNTPTWNTTRQAQLPSFNHRAWSRFDKNILGLLLGEAARSDGGP